jgi:hypothetical protein
MLKDPIEIEIISKAKQKNVRDPSRSRDHFLRIFADFLHDVDLADKILLDLGPGQYDFAELAMNKGAAVHGIDKDDAVIELGKHKGLPVKKGLLQALRAADFEPSVFDGLFSKLTLNAFWFSNDQAQIGHINELRNLIKDDGWAWIAPWNGVPKKRDFSSEEIEHILAIQINTFRKHGFDYIELTEDLSKYYGVHGITANRALFVRNLPIPQQLGAYRHKAKKTEKHSSGFPD